jgi:hypothetical protein
MGMSYWSEIENTYEEPDFEPKVDGAITRAISIDAWRENCDQGSTIAKVILTSSGDVCIVYMDNIARADAHAQEVIQQAVSLIKNGERS